MSLQSFLRTEGERSPRTASIPFCTADTTFSLPRWSGASPALWDEQHPQSVPCRARQEQHCPWQFIQEHLQKQRADQRRSREKEKTPLK